MKTRIRTLLWLIPILAIASYLAAVVSFRSEPSGYVASYSMFPHASNDVLDFSDGVVTLRTCCGDSPYGSFSRSPEGHWIWHLRMGAKNPRSRDVLVRPGFFSMSFVEVQDPTKAITLRRRVFQEFPL